LSLMVAVVVGVMRFLQRRWEFQADQGGAALTGDAEATITSLIKIARLNVQPMDWGRWEGRMLTHPSDSRRLKALARVGQIDADRLAHLVALPDDGSGSYELPATCDSEEPIFSTTMKRRRSVANVWAIRLTIMSILGLTALAAKWLELAGQNLALALVG